MSKSMPFFFLFYILPYNTFSFTINKIKLPLFFKKNYLIYNYLFFILRLSKIALYLDIFKYKR